MYLWKIDKLNEELVSHEMSEHETFKYLLANSILYSLAMIQYSAPNIYDTWSGILGGIVGLLGLFLIYKCNGGRNGKDFVIRYISIGWVIFVRMLVLLMLPSIIVMIVLMEIFMGGVSEESTNIDLIYMTIIEVIYLIWVAIHINRVAKAAHV